MRARARHFDGQFTTMILDGVRCTINQLRREGEENARARSLTGWVPGLLLIGGQRLPHNRSGARFLVLVKVAIAVEERSRLND